MAEKLPPLLRITGLWKRTTKAPDGTTKIKPGLQGSLSGNRVLILPNGDAKTRKANDPDYILYLAPPAPREETRAREPGEDDEVLP